MAFAEARVTGLTQMQRGLTAGADAAPDELRDVLADSAGLVATATRGAIPARSGHLRGSVGLVREKTEVTVRVSAVYAGRLDFGDPPWRPFVRGGRYLYPSLNRVFGRVEDRLRKGLIEVTKDAGVR